MKERKARTKAELKKRIICKKCNKLFLNDSNKIRIVCPICWNIIDARDRTFYAKKYAEKYPDKAKKRKESMILYDKEHWKERRDKNRKRMRDVILNIISNNNQICVNCWCDDTRLLEINHINWWGGKEMMKWKKSNAFYWDIYMGRRKTDDLNLLCKVCNSLHYLELKYGKTKHRIIYE